MTAAVFIGSSNATAGTWPEALCAEKGWTPHVFSIGGGGFSQSGPSRFITQLQTAAANVPDCAEIDYVFICDAGNDVRALAPIGALASAAFSEAETLFPNADVVVVPVLWGITPDNEIPSRMVSVTARYDELCDAAAGKRVEVIPDTWLWHWDSPGWMLPKSPTESGVHYTAAGYARIADFVGKYMRGASVECPIGWTFLWNPGPGVDPGTAWLRSRRNGNTGDIQGRFTLTHSVGADSVIGYLPRGTGPLENIRVPIITDTRVGGWLDVFPSGLVRAFTALGAGTWNVNGTLPIF